ncbi:MAG TPA: hypothetical protein VMB48_09480 [Steroidobacteraceae bacterium]|nr:hypothetical protein [Steroidobacteraceae bacterium]
MDTVSDTGTGEFEQFERNARAVLEYGLMHVDAHVRSRLNQARQAALAHKAPAHPPAWFTWGLMPATGAVAAAVVALVLLSPHPQAVPVADTPASALDVLDLVTDDDALSLMQDDDHTFYEWAAAQDAGGAAGTARAAGTGGAGI